MLTSINVSIFSFKEGSYLREGFNKKHEKLWNFSYWGFYQITNFFWKKNKIPWKSEMIRMA